MSSGGEQPYNSLGQIIAQGGEIALGLAIAHGWTSGQIALLFARRFEPMRDDDRERLVAIADRSFRAAYLLSNKPDDFGISLDDIPIIEGLYGGENEGRRIKVIGEWQFEEGGQWYETRLDFPDLISLNEMMAMIISHGRDVGERCRDKFGFDKDEPITVKRWRITFTGRAF